MNTTPPHHPVFGGSTGCWPGHAGQPVEPYLALKLDLEPHKIAELVLKVFPHVPPSDQE